MLLLRPPLLTFGRPGVKPAGFASAGDFPSPLANDLPALPDRENAEWLWTLLSPLPASGTTLVNDVGAYALVGPAVGTYTQVYRGLVMPASGAAQVYEATINVTVAAALQGGSFGLLRLTGASAGQIGIAGGSARTLPLNGVSAGSFINSPAVGQSVALLPLGGTSTGRASISGYSSAGLPLPAASAGQSHIYGQSAVTLQLLRGLAAPVVARREVVHLVSRLATRVELWSPLHMEG